MPPIIAILLALLTKEVYLSLFAGCALGALLVAEFHPWLAFDTLFNTMINSVDFSILMFMILLGMIVMLMQESGGTRAYGEWAAKKLKSKRATLVATSLLGALIFVDDYFNCLTVGSVMRPVTDKYKVSRAKLAYLIDATAAPVCIIAPISSWAAAVNSYVPAGSAMSGFEMFVRTIPFNLYALLTLYMVFFISLVGFDFGLMKKHERNAANGDLFTSGGEAFQNQETHDPTEGGKYAKGKVIDLIAPMIVMIATAIGAMIWTGYLNGGTNLVEDFANCSSSESLVFAGLITVGFLLVLYLPRRVIGFKDFMNSVPEGGKLMMPAILILVLAWTLKGMTDALGIGDFVRQAVSLNAGLMRFVPLLIFCIAIFIAFSSGTSWGTFAILVPIVVNMFSETDPNMMIANLRHHHHVQFRRTVQPHQPRADPDAVCHGRGGCLRARLPDCGLYRELAAHLGRVPRHPDRDASLAAQAQFSRIKKAVLSKLKALLFILRARADSISARAVLFQRSIHDLLVIPRLLGVEHPPGQVGKTRVGNLCREA